MGDNRWRKSISLSPTHEAELIEVLKRRADRPGTNMHTVMIDLIKAGLEYDGVEVRRVEIEPALLRFVANLLDLFKQRGITDEQVHVAAQDAGLPDELVNSLKDRIGSGAGSRR